MLEQYRKIGLGFATFLLFFGAGFVIKAQETERGYPVKGHYINSDFGYSVEIPRGMIGYTPPQPAIEHGFVSEISKADRAYISVQASYLPGAEKTLDEIIEDHLHYLGSEKHPKVIRKTATRMTLEIPIEEETKPPAEMKVVPTRKSSLEAVRVLIECDSEQGQEKTAQDFVIACFKQREGMAIVYFISLQSPESVVAKYAHFVDEIQKNFVILKMYR